MKIHTLLKNSIILLFFLSLSISACKKDENKEDEKKAPEQWEVIVYGISDCIYCTNLKDDLDSASISFQFYDINSNNAKRTEMLDKLAAAGIPNSDIKWPIVDVITDSVSHILIRPKLSQIKTLIGQ